jgi:hypothetical protein
LNVSQEILRESDGRQNDNRPKQKKPPVALSHAIFISQWNGSAELREAGLLPSALELELLYLDTARQFVKKADLQESGVLWMLYKVLNLTPDPKRGYGTLVGMCSKKRWIRISIHSWGRRSLSVGRHSLSI